MAWRMRALLGLLVALSLAWWAAVPGAAQGAPGVEYRLVVDCPERGDGVPLNQVVCPVRAQDFPQYLLGSPSLAVNPRHTQEVIFHALHDQRGDGPTDRSRQGTPFTTFVSPDHGGTWYDRYYPPPAQLRGAYGEHSQAVFGRDGRVTVGSLYAVPDGHAPHGFVYVIVAQKFEDLHDLNQNQDGSHNGQYLEPAHADNVIQEFWFLYDEVADVMVLVWDEVNPTIEAGGPPGVIGMAWTTPRASDPYRYVPTERLVGPCLRATNPALLDGWVVVGCVADHRVKGHAWTDEVHEGRIDLFRVDPRTGEREHLGPAPVDGGTPRLAVREDGSLALLTAGIGSDGHPRLAVAFGTVHAERGTVGWQRTEHVGHKVFDRSIGRPVVDAQVQAVAYRDSGAVVAILKERFADPGLDLRQPESATWPIFRKTLTAVHPNLGVLVTHDLDVGNRVNRTAFNPTPAYLGGDRVFDDLADSLLQLPPGPYAWGEEDLGPEYRRLFFAVGDYGVVQFSELIEITDLAPAAAVPAVALPGAFPTAAVSAQVIGMTVLGTALVGLLTLKLALSRSRTASAAITKGE